MKRKRIHSTAVKKLSNNNKKILQYNKMLDIMKMKNCGGEKMKIIGKNGMCGLVEWMIHCIFVGGIGIWISLPWSLPWVMGTIKPQYEYGGLFFKFMMIFLYVTGVFALGIVWETRKFFHSVNQNEPFIYENVKALKRISYFSFVIALCYGVKILPYPTILTIVIAMVFMIVGCFSLVLAEVFRQAVDVKQENDLTI